MDKFQYAEKLLQITYKLITNLKLLKAGLS